MSRGRSARAASPTRRGFALVELLVAVTVGALLVVALQQAILGQRRYYQSQRAAAQRHETVRFAMAILTGALREASPGTDIDILGPGRVRARMPLGVAHVCGTDNNGSRVGAVGMQGRWTAGVGDSVLVLRSGAWMAEGLRAVAGPDPRVPCVAGGGSVFRLDRRVPDVEPGSAARAFRSVVFEVDTDGVFYWLYRWDGPQRDLLLGPLDGPTGFRVWFEDGQGVEIPGPTGADRVGVRIVARSADPDPSGVLRRDTLVMTFGGRNR